MKRTIILAAIAATLTLTPAQAADRWQCARIPDYRAAMLDAIPVGNDDLMAALRSDDITTLRPSKLAGASDGFDQWAENLEDMPRRSIPRAASEYHAGFADMIDLAAGFTLSLSTGNTMGALMYADAVDQATTDMQRGDRLAAQRCPQEWEATDTSKPDGQQIHVWTERA